MNERQRMFKLCILVHKIYMFKCVIVGSVKFSF